MNASEIHDALKSNGFNWSTAAVAMSRSAGSLMNVAARRSESKYVARSLAALILKDVSEVFPDVPRYAYQESPKNKAIENAKQRLQEAGLLDCA